MTTFEPPDVTCSPESSSVTATAVNDNIKSLATKFKDMAEACPSVYRVAETTTEGVKVDNYGGPNERIEDPGRYIAPAQSSLRSLAQVVSTKTP